MLKLYTPKTELTFGKYNGLTIEQICQKDPQYVAWCYNTIDGFNVTPAVASMVNKAVAESDYAGAYPTGYDTRYEYENDYEDVDYDDPFIWDDPLNF